MQKQEILELIKASRAGMRVVNSCATTFPELADVCHKIVETEQSNIKNLFAELVELERVQSGQEQ